jgi:hypothetical protein
VQQADLRRAGVLELVDQQVADAVVEPQLQAGGFGLVPCAAQCFERTLRDLDEVDFALLLEHRPQLRGGELEQLREDGDDARLVGYPAPARAAAAGGPGPPRRPAWRQGISMQAASVSFVGLSLLSRLAGPCSCRSACAELPVVGEQQRGEAAPESAAHPGAPTSGPTPI